MTIQHPFLQPPTKMKRSSSQTSMKPAPQAKTATTRSAVSSKLRRQTSASTVRRGTPSDGTQVRQVHVSSVTKRQTIASKPPTSVNKSAKASASESLKGITGE